jgi:hypothetical protein
VFVAAGVGSVGDEEEDTVLLVPLASLMPLAVLLNTVVVAVLRALTARTTLVTSKSKRIAYSGAETAASSLAIRRNMLAPQPLIRALGA